MKVSNVQNLLKTLNQNEPEIEVHGDFSESVIKAGLNSNVLFAAVIFAIITFSVSAVLGTVYIFMRKDILMTLAIIFVSTSIFATATMLTLIFTQKISLSLSMKLRKYTVSKHNNTVILKLKSNH